MSNTDGDTFGDAEDIMFDTNEMKSDKTRSDGLDLLQILNTNFATNSASSR